MMPHAPLAPIVRETGQRGPSNSWICRGLSVEQQQRLPKIDRTEFAGALNAQISWQSRPLGALSPAVPREESEWVLRDWRLRGSLQIRGVTSRGEGVAEATPRVPAGNQLVSGVFSQDPAWFCGKIRAVFGTDVYRNSTVDPGSG